MPVAARPFSPVALAALLVAAPPCARRRQSTAGAYLAARVAGGDRRLSARPRMVYPRADCGPEEPRSDGRRDSSPTSAWAI